MKVTGSTPVGPPTAARGHRDGGGFALSGASAASAPSAAAPATGLASVASVAALVALQADGEIEGRRRRALKRGGGLLDRLDALKLALLEGGDGASALQALARASAEQRVGDDDPGLQAVLDQIETRAAVELAKARYRIQA